jgi:tripeptide aminopeptidase
MQNELITKLLNLAIQIQQIPAPTFDELARASFLREKFLSEGLGEVSIDDLGNVFARLQGRGESRPLVVSAHTDTVFPLDTRLELKRNEDSLSGPGIGDNSLGVAGLFGLLWGLRQDKLTGKLPGDIWLVANVGEEGLGDLRGMRAVVERFGNTPLAYIVLEGMALSQIFHRGLVVKRYRIDVITSGGHSWVDYGRPSAIHELAGLIVQLNALPLPAKPRTTLNIGVISGGTTVNTIASHAYLELDLRSESARPLKELDDQVKTLVQSANRQGIRASFELIGERPAGKIPVSHPLVILASHCLRAQGIKPRLNIGSTDANLPLSLGLPAICIGLTNGSGAHSMNETIQVAPLSSGLNQLLMLVEEAFTQL